MLRRVLHRFLRQSPVLLVLGIRVSPRQQAASQRIRIMYLAVQSRDIA